MTDPKIHHLRRIGVGSAMRIYGLTARALRFYEERGLIEARRDRQNNRVYDSDALWRLDWIAQLRRAGVSLEEIRGVLRAEDDEGRGEEYALSAVARRRDSLEAQLGQTKDALESLQATLGSDRRRVGLPAQG
jgi:DNA-binding transcriptional MerR regulator